MPIYEYHCGACGHEFEVLQKITDSPKRKCEACGRLKAKRLISSTNFQLKGSGWYVTDYGGKKGGGNGAEPTKSGGNGAKSTESGGKGAKSTESDGNGAKSTKSGDKDKSKGESAAA